MSCAGFCYRAAPPWSSARFALHPVRSAKRPDGFLLSTGNALPLSLIPPLERHTTAQVGGRPPYSSCPTSRSLLHDTIKPGHASPFPSPREDAARHHTTPNHVQTYAAGLAHSAHRRVLPVRTVHQHHPPRPKHEGRTAPLSNAPFLRTKKIPPEMYRAGSMLSIGPQWNRPD